jgi:hypothetical protein
MKIVTTIERLVGLAAETIMVACRHGEGRSASARGASEERI